MQTSTSSKLSLRLWFLLIVSCLYLSVAEFALAASENIETEKSIAEDKTANDEQLSITKPIALVTQHKEDLKHYLNTEQVKPLLAGPDDYLTLVKRYTSANGKGVVILLPEWQQGATNPKAINFLRNALPAEGWTTIAIQPNSKPDNYPSLAATVEEQVKENKISLDDYKNKLSALVNAVMNTAKEYPGIVLMVAEGNNAALLVDIYSQAGNTLPNALILLSSYRQSSNELTQSANSTFALQLARTEIPVLDLYLKYDNALVVAKAAERKAKAKQEMKVYYRQRQLNNAIAGYYPENELLSQIKGWLKNIGW